MEKKKSSLSFLILLILFFVVTSGGCGGDGSSTNDSNVLPNSEIVVSQDSDPSSAKQFIEINLDASELKVTLSTPPVDIFDEDATRKSTGVQVSGDSFKGMEKYTLDEIVVKHNLNKKEASRNAGLGSEDEMGVVKIKNTMRTAIPTVTPSLSIGSAYSAKNKSVQAKITAQGQIHWYKLVVDSSDSGREFMCILTDIPQGCDYDMYISADGTNFSGMPMAGNAMEQWSVQLPMGTYYVVVYSDVQINSNQAYTLFAGRRYWNKLLTIDIPDKAWDVNGYLRSVNPMRLGYELWGDGWHLVAARYRYNLNSLPYETIPYGATVHHHTGYDAEFGSKLYDGSVLRSLSEWNFGTLERLGAYHRTRPTNATYASAMSGVYRYRGDTRINDNTANLINRSVKFPVRQEYELIADWDGVTLPFPWETYYYVGTQSIWIEFEAHYLNLTHFRGNDGAGIPCQSK